MTAKGSWEYPLERRQEVTRWPLSFTGKEEQRTRYMDRIFPVLKPNQQKTTWKKLVQSNKIRFIDLREGGNSTGRVGTQWRRRRKALL